MGKIMRSYGTFTTFGYRILALYLIPLGYLIGSVLWGISCVERGVGYFFQVFMLTSYLVCFEVIADYWVFAGRLGRDGENLVLFKTSTQGLAFLRRAAIGDCLRRFCWLMIYAGFMFAVTGEAYHFVMLLAAYVVVTGILNLTRHLQIVQMHMMCMVLAALIYGTLAVTLYFIAEAAGTWMLVTELALFSLLALAVSGLSVWHILYCMRGKSDDK